MTSTDLAPIHLPSDAISTTEAKKRPLGDTNDKNQAKALDEASPAPKKQMTEASSTTSPTSIMMTDGQELIANWMKPSTATGSNGSSSSIVQAVLLKASGEVEAIALDTAPEAQHVAKLLHSSDDAATAAGFTFLGQYAQEGLMLMIPNVPVVAGAATAADDEKKDDSNSTTLYPVNKHVLQPPFQESTVHGDILIVKVAEGEDDEEKETPTASSLLASKTADEEDAFFLDYSVQDYQTFASRTDVQVPEAVLEAMKGIPAADDEKNEEAAEESDEEVEGESDEEDDDTNAFVDMLMGHVIKKFQAEHGRLPDEAELKTLEDAVTAKLQGQLGAEEEQDEEAEEGAETVEKQEAGAGTAEKKEAEGAEKEAVGDTKEESPKEANALKKDDQEQKEETENAETTTVSEK